STDDRAAMSEVAEDVVAIAMAEGRCAEQARLEMNVHARRRQQAILRLNDDFGLSVRAIAGRLGCSPSFVQKALRSGRPGARAMSAAEGTTLLDR
ncbi:MAG: helix-turn-helix domain-containing protein, partial [Actinomycetota bacterium]|nr:helix-turn-helix domain-containing protein [Actinomycetota bacterium]